MSNTDFQKICKNPLVSVSIITYNHKDFIGDAIDSVLKQEVDFEYEIIIGDDFSNDGTQEILKQYQKKYPDKIQLILHPRDYENIPGRINNTTNLYACRGKYIAMLDGDDAWISTDKLQKQIDFLESNTDFALCYTETMFHYPNKEVKLASSFYPDLMNGETVYSSDDVLSRYFIQTSSMAFRNHLIGEFPEWFWEVYSADYAIQLLVTRHGKVKYFPDLKSKRNFHSNSFSATQNTSEEHLERRNREETIFAENFPGYRDLRDFIRFLQKHKEALKFLPKRPFSMFLKDMKDSYKHGGRFLMSRNLGTSRKLTFMKTKILKRF